MEMPGPPPGLPDISVSDAGLYEPELNTTSFEEMLVKQVQDIVSLRQQGGALTCPQAPRHGAGAFQRLGGCLIPSRSLAEIRKTEANLQMALKELQSVKQQEQSLLQRRTAHFKREFQEKVGELERQFIAQVPPPARPQVLAGAGHGPADAASADGASRRRTCSGK